MAHVATQRQPSDLTNDAISQVFIAHRPREKKINKTLKKFNKRVSKVGTHISRTTGIVDVGDSDSGESTKNEEDIGDDFYDEDGMLKYDSELKIVHDSLVPIPQQPKIRNPYSEYADYDYEQRTDENSRILRAQRHELEYQKRTARLQEEWASQQQHAGRSGLRSAMKKSRPISFEEPKSAKKESSAGSFNFVGQSERHQLYRKQKSRATTYAAAEYSDDDGDEHDDHRISNPSRQETYYSYYEDEMRAKRRKREAEEREKSKKGVWNAYIDTDEDQDPLTDVEDLAVEGAAGARGIASNGGNGGHTSSESVIARLPTPDLAAANNQDLELSAPLNYTTTSSSSSPGTGGARLKSKAKVEKKEKMNNYTGRALNAMNNAIFDQSAPASRFSAKSLFGKKQKRVVAPLAATPPPELNGSESAAEYQSNDEVNHEEQHHSSSSRPPSPAKSVKPSTSSNAPHSVAGSAKAGSHHSTATVIPGHLPTPPPGSPVASMHSRKSSPTPSGSVVGSHVSGSHHSGVSAAASAVPRGSVAGGSHASSAAQSRRSHTNSHATHTSGHSRHSHASERTHRSSQSRHSTVVPEVAPEVVETAPAAKTTGAQLYDYWLNARGYVGGMIWGKKEVVTTTTTTTTSEVAAAPIEEAALGSRPPSMAGSAASKRSVSASPTGSFVGSVASGRSKHSSQSAAALSHHSSHHSLAASSHPSVARSHHSSVAHSYHSESPSIHSASIRSPAPSVHSSHHSIALSHRSRHSEAAHSVVPGSFVSGVPGEGSIAAQSHHGSAVVGSVGSGGGGGGAFVAGGEAIVLEEALDEHSTFSHHSSGSPVGSIMAREMTDNDEYYNSDDEYAAKEERRRKFKSAMKNIFQRKSSTGGSVYSQDPLSLPSHPPASSLYEGSVPGGSMRSGHSRHTIAPTILDDASIRSGRESTRSSRRSGRSGMSMRSMSEQQQQQHGTRPPSMRSIRSSNTVVPQSRAGTIVNAEGVSQEVAVAGGGSKFGVLGDKWNQFAGPMQPVVSNFVDMFRSTARLSFILRPVDAVADAVPSLQNAVVVVELVLLMWILYQVSIVVETMATFVKTLCMPVIMVSRALGLKM